MADFKPNPDLEAQLEAAYKEKMAAVQAEVNAAIAQRGTKTDEQLVAELAELLRARGIEPNMATLRSIV